MLRQQGRRLKNRGKSPKEETDEIEDCGTVTVDADGNATFTISHCSDYFISSKVINLASSTTSEKPVTLAKNPKSGDSNSSLPIWLVAIFSVTALVVLSKKRRFKSAK